MPPILQVTRKGTVFSGSEKETKRLREEFNRNHCLRLKGFLEPALLEFVLRKVDQPGRFSTRRDRINRELYLKESPASALLVLTLNDPSLLWAVRRLTGCESVGSFEGKGIWRLMPEKGHAIGWHNDLVADRAIQLDLHLSRQAHQGGILQIRDSKTKRILQEAPRIDLGDALLIQLSPGIEHRFTPVQGRWPRTAFGGWFRARQNFQASLKRRLLRIRNRNLR